MTRSTKLALVTLLAGLLSFASIGTVSADTACTGKAQEHCEQMATADDAILFHAAVAAPPVHILSGNGIGQEHFEAMTTEQFTVFSVAASAPLVHLPGKAIEHYEQMMASSAGN